MKPSGPLTPSEVRDLPKKILAPSLGEPGGGLANTREGQMEELYDLIRHCWVHSAYNNCGFLQMTGDQKDLYGSIIGHHEDSDWWNSVRHTSVSDANDAGAPPISQTPSPSLPAVPDVKEEEKTLEEPGDVAANTRCVQMAREMISDIVAALTWLDEFVEVPETFPGEGDYQWWNERRQQIRGYAKKLNLSLEETKSEAGSEFPQTSLETGGRNALNLQMGDTARLDWLERAVSWHDEARRVKIIFPFDTTPIITLREAIDKALQDARAASDGKEQGVDLGKPEAQ